jgi:hypothetical protein
MVKFININIIRPVNESGRKQKQHDAVSLANRRSNETLFAPFRKWLKSLISRTFEFLKYMYCMTRETLQAPATAGDSSCVLGSATLALLLTAGSLHNLV